MKRIKLTIDGEPMPGDSPVEICHFAFTEMFLIFFIVFYFIIILFYLFYFYLFFASLASTLFEASLMTTYPGKDLFNLSCVNIVTINVTTSVVC